MNVTYSPDRRAKIGGRPWGHCLPTTEFTGRQLVDCFWKRAFRNAGRQRSPSTEAHRKNRRNFCKEHRNWQYREWECVIVVDKIAPMTPQKIILLKLQPKITKIIRIDSAGLKVLPISFLYNRMSFKCDKVEFRWGNFVRKTKHH